MGQIPPKRIYQVPRRASALQSKQKAPRSAVKDRQLFENIPIAIFIFKGKKNLLVNPAAATLTGYSRQELLRMEFWKIIHPGYSLMVYQRGVARQRGVKVPARYEVKIIRKDGVERWIESSEEMINWRAKPAIIRTAVDITDRKNAEETLRVRLTQLQTLNDAFVATNSNLELDNVLKILLATIDTFFSIPVAAVIRLRDDQTGAVEAIALRNISEEAWSKLMVRAGSGLSREVFEGKTSVMTLEARDDPRVRHPEFFRQLGFVSYLGLPLVIDDRAIGDVGLFTKERHEFSDEEISFVTALTSQAAKALENSRLYEQAKGRTDKLAALDAISKAVTHSHDLGAALQNAAQVIARVARFDDVRIFVFDDVAQTTQLKAIINNDPDLLPLVRVITRDVGISGRVTDSGEPLIFEDIQTDGRYAELSQTGWAKTAGARFVGVFPIQTKLKSWGTLACTAKERRTLNIGDIDLIKQMCDQVAVAIENASLIHGTMEKTRELTTLYSVVGDCMRFLDVNELLYKTIQRVLEVFGIDAVRVYLRAENHDKLNLAAHEGFEPHIKLPECYKFGQGLIGSVALSGECLAFEDMQNDAECLQRAGTEVLWRAGYGGALFIPLKARDGIVGVMNIASKKPHQLSSAELERIKAIAYHLGIAIGNARLFWQLTRRTRELVKANQAKDEFLGIISHELRTPVNVILGYTDVMTKHIAGDLTPQVHAMVSKVATQAKALSVLVENILVTTNIEAGNIETTTSEINLADWLTRLRGLYERPINKDVQLIWDIPFDLPVIMTDSIKLQRILQSLIDNAIKFTDEGSVTITARAISGDKISFMVRDTGVGIAQKDTRRIFDMLVLLG